MNEIIDSILILTSELRAQNHLLELYCLYSSIMFVNWGFIPVVI